MSRYVEMRDEGGQLLFWFVTAINGFDEFDIPGELSLGDGDVECELGDAMCPDTRRSVLAKNERSRLVQIELGAMEHVGRYVVLNGDNTRSQCEGSNQPYFHGVKLAAVRGSKASLAAKDEEAGSDCSAQTNENDCNAIDSCRAITAYDVAGPSEGPRFITCIVDDTCGDGDLSTCATNDETDEVVQFTTTCVPPGWTEADASLCEAHAEDAGTN